ncbi:unnamed protein product [Amoebophrya sp. A25]|nr:unnamed protein product [Amoebophrya sp. A25]|eukprot:GSA25T00001429001.1
MIVISGIFVFPPAPPYSPLVVYLPSSVRSPIPS